MQISYENMGLSRKLDLLLMYRHFFKFFSLISYQDIIDWISHEKSITCLINIICKWAPKLKNVNKHPRLTHFLPIFQLKIRQSSTFYDWKLFLMLFWMKLAYLLKVSSWALVIISIICKWVSQMWDMHSPKACFVIAQRVVFVFFTNSHTLA